MAPSSDSMFLFELVVEDLKSFIDCKEFIIKSQFADVFTLHLNDLSESKEVLTQTDKKRKCKKKTKLRRGSKLIENPKKGPIENKIKMGQSIIITYNIDLLISNMKNYPMELSLWSKKSHRLIGSNHIPWSPSYIEYLKKVLEQQDPCPVSVDGQYNVFDELTSKRMATVKLNVKLSHLKNSITQFQSFSDNEQHIQYTTPIQIDSTAKNITVKGSDEISVIKSVYYNRKSTINCNNHQVISGSKSNNNNMIAIEKEKVNDFKTRKRSINLIKSDTTICTIGTHKNKKLDILKSRSDSTLNEKLANTLNYIFGDTGPYGNQVYCVGYFTIEKNIAKGSNSLLDKKIKKSGSGNCTESVCSFHLNLSNTSVNTCKKVECNYKHYRELPAKPDERVLLDLTNLKKECCNVTQKIEDVVGGMTANMQFGNDPCMCTCECKFGFTKRTTYCKTCGGYEHSGEDMTRKAEHEMPFPCPIFHKIAKGKPKPLSSSDKRSASDKRSKNNDDRFKFKYGYEGIPPKIGHSQCGMPCTGAMGTVPKKMGWLWNAVDVPGMKFRPMWKPGAISKHVVRLLKIAKNPGELQGKKRRKDGGKKSRPLKRPLLIVHKKDGEFTVTMETMKLYSKRRSFNQYPYEDKPVLTYTIGRTEEENRQRQIKKERTQRRLERAQRLFIQSAFRDMCQEICLKTYQQALEILPNAEDPDCLCYPAEPGADRTNLDVSCSCSEDKSTTSETTDTDSDEWIVEFTPPNATFYPTYKGKKVFKNDSYTQYTYLDYKVKKLDLSGNPVPRFFKGPDGKEECSDLGGFWSPDKKWLDINVDGYIGPDERWAPMAFTGPNGEPVDCENGKFQAVDGAWLTVGVDGYIDPQGNWKFYPHLKQRKSDERTRRKCKRCTEKKNEKILSKSSEAAWSCLGDATPRQLSKMGILGHGQDRKLLLDTLKAMLAQGQDVHIPVQSTVPRLPPSKRNKKRQVFSTQCFDGKTKCKHPTPSEKGIIAVDGHGNKAYFRKDYQNKRPQERRAYLSKQGISLNSFHLPCFQSFISSEVMKKELYEKLQARYEKNK